MSAIKRNICFLCVALMLLLSGCSADGDGISETGKNETIQPAAAGTDEDRPVKDLANYPGVLDFVDYLGLDRDGVRVLEEDEQHLIYALKVDFSVDIHDENLISYASYVRALEKAGFQMELYDATRSQTFVLENEQYRIDLTLISDLPVYIEDFKSEIDHLESLDGENAIFSIKKK